MAGNHIYIFNGMTGSNTIDIGMINSDRYFRIKVDFSEAQPKCERVRKKNEIVNKTENRTKER